MRVGKRAECKERQHPLLQYGHADKNVLIKKWRLENWAYSLAQGSDQVSSAGVRASGTGRVVAEAWGAVAAWFGLVRGRRGGDHAQSAGACPQRVRLPCNAGDGSEHSYYEAGARRLQRR